MTRDTRVDDLLDARAEYYGGTDEGAQQTIHEELMRRVLGFRSSVRLADAYAVCRQLVAASTRNRLLARCFAYDDVRDFLVSEGAFVMSVLAEVTPESLATARATFQRLSGHHGAGRVARTALEVFLGDATPEALEQEVNDVQGVPDKLVIAWAAVGALIIAIVVYVWKKTIRPSEEYQAVAKAGGGAPWCDVLLQREPPAKWRLASAWRGASLDEVQRQHAIATLASLKMWRAVNPVSGTRFDGAVMQGGRHTQESQWVVSVLRPGLATADGMIIERAHVSLGTSHAVALEATSDDPLSAACEEQYREQTGASWKGDATLSPGILNPIADAATAGAVGAWLQRLADADPSRRLAVVSPAPGDRYRENRMMRIGGTAKNLSRAVVEKMSSPGLVDGDQVLLLARVTIRDDEHTR